MGRCALDVPTVDNVHEVIEKLKPHKRELWRQDAQEKGWLFAEYVIARIRNNVAHRAQRRLEQEGTAAEEQEAGRIEDSIGAATGADAGAVQDGLAGFGTQELEEELASRKRRRKERDTDDPAGHGLRQRAEQTPPASGQAHHTGPLYTTGCAPLPDLRPYEDRQIRTPPSGGEASRRDGSFALARDSLIASETQHITESDDADHSLAAGKQVALESLPSPVSTISWEEDVSQHSDTSVLATQFWQDFLDSSQGKRIDGEIPIPQRTVSGYKVGRRDNEVQPRPFLHRRESAAFADLDKWRLDVKDVPDGMKRLWCVRDGYVLGFHFSEPYRPEPSRTGAVQKFRCESFDFAGRKLEDVVAAANAYMNHLPHECLPRYRMCYADCTKLAALQPVGGAKQEAKKPHEPSERPLCIACGSILDYRNGSLCQTCAFDPQADDDIAFCVGLFSLCSEQERILRLAATGRNIFYTGAAGTGKSQLLRAIVRYCHRKKVEVDVVSPTGITALNVGGKTVHMYAGWGLKAEEYPLKRLVRDAKKDKNWRRLSNTQILIIDEISMVSNFMLMRLDAIMRAARHAAEEPFGGVQVIITGDFYQLPPVRPFKTCLRCGLPMTRVVGRQSEFRCVDGHGSINENEKWAFSAPVWDKCHFTCAELKRIHRQADADFCNVLNKLRIGAALSDAEHNMLFGQARDFDESKAIKICPFRDSVNNINERELDRLGGEEFSFRCVDSYEWNEELHPELEGRFDRVDPEDSTSCLRAYAGEERHRFDEGFRFKEGMPVILLANIDPSKRLVNGSRGVIVGFAEFDNDELQEAHQNRNEASLRGEWILSSKHAEYQEAEIKKFISRAVTKRWPIVQFDDGTCCTIYAYCAVQELGIVREEATQERFSLMSRTQIPLSCGWAMTTHKSQGITLERAIVDPTGSWEPGQVYVALSRVRSLQGLKVRCPADGRAARPSEEVQEFMRRTFGMNPGGKGWSSGAGS